MRKSVLIAAAAVLIAAGAGFLALDGGSLFSANTTANAQNAQPAAPAVVKLVEVTDDNFDAEVMQSVNAGVPVLVDVYAVWCGPCRAYRPIFEAVSTEYTGKVKFVRLNGERAVKVAQAIRLQSFPTTVLIKKDASGKVVYYTMSGAFPAKVVRYIVDKGLDGSLDMEVTPRALPPLK
jgi:thioredoxin 1